MADAFHEARIQKVEQAFERVAEVVSAMDDRQVREASRLPGWTRGHVVTHLARNADGNWNIVEGALAGEERLQYPDGATQRVDEIEDGAHRSVAELTADLERSQTRLVSAWRRLADGEWERSGVWLVAGRRPITAGLRARRRELLVHLVDLDLGIAPSELSEDFLDEQRDWLVEHRTASTWPDAPWVSGRSEPG